ncbi:MAG: NUDIX domain-containing protein [bacterium]|nr:NUDIX domain-containing protein [bacterium]
MAGAVVTRYVCGFYFLFGRVVLIEKKRPDWMAGKRNGVGGHIESGEEPVDAMVREFEEETGVRVSRERWEHCCTLHSVHAGEDAVVFWFRVDYAAGDPGVRSMTDELIGERTHPYIYAMSNLGWLIEMAMSKNRHDWPYSVSEKGPS